MTPEQRNLLNEKICIVTLTFKDKGVYRFMSTLNSKELEDLGITDTCNLYDIDNYKIIPKDWLEFVTDVTEYNGEEIVNNKLDLFLLRGLI